MTDHRHLLLTTMQLALPNKLLAFIGFFWLKMKESDSPQMMPRVRERLSLVFTYFHFENSRVRIP
jgi:hypothetical protein